MKPLSFRVTKFRNIVDSGDIRIDESVTAFVGKNEAGKSGLLEALYLANPAYADKFNLDEHYPRWLVVRDRKAGNINHHSPVQITLALDDEDRDAVTSLFGKEVLTGETVTFYRKYDNSQAWSIQRDERAAIAHLVAKFRPSLREQLRDVSSLDELTAALAEVEGESVAKDVEHANAILKKVGLDSKSLVQMLMELLGPRLPRFFRFTSYSTLPGRIDFAELAKSKDDGPAKSGLQTARALLSLAGTDPKLLTNESYELRKSELEAVQIDLTRQVFEYWKQNPHLEVLIDVDKVTVQNPNGHHAVSRYLDIRLRDIRTGYSNNFSQRSSGFQWFFSFLAAFSEFEGKENAPLVLLDEPALTLHGKAQADFLRFINERLAAVSQVLYTTHSPFMVEPTRLARVRIVEDNGPPDGVSVSDEVLAIDPDSLFPLQAALGYDIAQSLFVGPNNLVVEGTSELIYLTALSALCRACNRTELDSRWRILPAGGATNIPTFVSLVGPSLDVTVLADSDTKGMQRVTNMIDRKLLARHRLILASAAVENAEADIEDLFSVEDFVGLYDETFGTVTDVAQLPPGLRITKRLETMKGPFNHGQVAETLMRRATSAKFSDATLDRFAQLFGLINATMKPS